MVVDIDAKRMPIKKGMPILFGGTTLVHPNILTLSQGQVTRGKRCFRSSSGRIDSSGRRGGTAEMQNLFAPVLSPVFVSSSISQLSSTVHGNMVTTDTADNAQCTLQSIWYISYYIFNNTVNSTEYTLNSTE